MKKVIVTGANGFVGTALCRELSAQDIIVTAIIRDETENIEALKDLPGLSIVYADLSRFYMLHEIIKDRGFDALFHLAWVGAAGPLRADADIQMNNIKFTCETAKACKKLDCKRMIFASSIMEYEIAATMATEAIPGVNTLYCSAKIAADYMARTIAGSLDIDYIRAVISNIYGPGEKSPRLVNTSLRKMLAGEHCAFSAGEQMYDFIYITDAAKSFVAIAEKGISNRTYYIGSLAPKPLKDFLLDMRDCVDPDIQIGLGELPFNGVSLSYKEFDIHAISDDTGFVPKVSFREGIKSTIAWLREVG